MASTTRRRGEALERAIYDAVLDELAATGYDNLTMEGVAARAQTGKAALYRRWPGKRDLVLEALRTTLPDVPELRLYPTLRGGLFAALTAMTDVLSGRTHWPGVPVLLSLFKVPELREAFRDQVVQPRQAVISEVFAAAVERGEIDASSVTPELIMTGPALVLATFLLEGQPPSKRELGRIADHIVAPLVK
jgi:AcrR family transcriptional regulator